MSNLIDMQDEVMAHSVCVRMDAKANLISGSTDLSGPAWWASNRRAVIQQAFATG